MNIDAESAPIDNPTFWQFDIWNPSLSSTTTTTTTPPTTGTVTTRVRLKLNSILINQKMIFSH